MLAGLVPCLAVFFGIVAYYESRAVQLQTAEIQNQCTILCNQFSTYGYLSDTSSEVINANLSQLTDIYNGRVMVIDGQLRVVRDTYDLDEGKTDVSENVIRSMQGETVSYYDRQNHYIEVSTPIPGPEGEGIAGVMQASVSTDTIEDTISELHTQGGVIIGIAMFLLALAGVFAADRVVRPLHRITRAIESVTEGYTDDVLHVETFTETRQMSEHLTRCWEG